MFLPHRRKIAAALLLICAIGGLPAASAARMTTTGTISATGPIPEGNDYATQVWGDAWDMNEYTDVSQYINESGQRPDIKNIGVSGGVFSADGDKNPTFFTLFPGYLREPATGSSGSDPKAIQTGKVGVLRPIDSARYKCLSFAMQVTNAPFQPNNPAQLLITWYKNGQQNSGAFAGSVWGGTGGKPLVLPRTSGLANSPSGWTLYTYNLGSEALGQGNTAWNASTWAGLQIDPIQEQGYAGAHFDVDWVRLTDCAANNVSVSWSGGGNALYVRPQGTSRAIFVKTVSGNSASFDANTLAAGTYDVCIGSVNTGTGADSGNPCATVISPALVINARPTATFASPSAASGQDYATTAGNPWDFSDSADASVVNGTGSYSNGQYTVITQSGPLPAGLDVQMRMNVPGGIDPTQYRYLTFKMNTSWRANWQNVPDGMIGRWIWQIQGTSGRVGFRCTLVSWDIPFDIGDQTYTIDLHNALNGRANEAQGECPNPLPTWRTGGTVLGIRFDPNENVTVAAQANKPSLGGPFTQVFDYIKLTTDNTVRRGQAYSVLLGASKPGVSATYFYTTDRNNPTQNPAAAFTTTPIPPPAGAKKTFTPLIISGGTGSVDTPNNPLSFRWNTAGVGAGSYYICARLNDGVQTNDVCSEVPVVVTG